MTSRKPATPYAVRLPNMGKHLYPLALREADLDRRPALLAATPAENTRGQLYVHLPFCQHICTFCLIQKSELRPSSPVADYVSALQAELESYSRTNYVRHLPITSIYFGGGTPSVLDDCYLAAIMETISRLFRLENPQITFEGNVQSLTRQKMRFVRGLGFNRLSAGVQTLDSSLRKALNLIPTISDIRRCVENARSEGFEDINLDLMFNLPGQTPTIWERDLLETVAMRPSGIDVFETVIAQKTPLYGQIARRELAPIRDAAQQAHSYEIAEHVLGSNGYEQKNLYVWTRRGFRNELMDCQEELRDRTLDIIGTGISSYSFINGTAYFNEARLPVYLKKVQNSGCAVVASYQPTEEQMMARFMIMSLQTFNFDRAKFEITFGRDMDTIFAEPLRSFERRGLTEACPQGYRLTPLGRAWTSTMAVEFYDLQYLQDVMRARLENRIAPGITLEEEYDHIIFALFHPEIILKPKFDFRLVFRYLRLLRSSHARWLPALAQSVRDRWLAYRQLPWKGYLAAASKVFHLNFLKARRHSRATRTIPCRVLK